MAKDKVIALACVIILLVGTIYFYQEEANKEEVVEEPEVDPLLNATRNYLAAGKQIVVTANALYANLNDGFSGNDPFILSIRSLADYEKGHIPGAVNIPFRSVFTVENISKLPFNKQIVVVCYSGHTASQIAALLSTAGYDSVALKFGINSWTTNTTIAGGYYKRDTDVQNYPVIIGALPGTMQNAVIVGTDLGGCGDDDPVGGPGPDAGKDDLIGRINNSLASGKPPAIKNTGLFDLLNDTNVDNDPYLLSIRSADQYGKGHIPGSVNIAWRQLFTDENMSLLPDDDTLIVVICYTGHTASQVTALLNANGYNATALKFGMTSWTNNGTVAPSYYIRVKDTMNFPMVVGGEPGTLADAEVIGPEIEVPVDVLGATQDYLAMGKAIAIPADAVYSNLNDGFSGNDPFVLSIRKAEDYAKGHIPGAVNIGRTGLFTEENMSKLPTNRQIVVVCYTGHTASHVTAMLNLAGYDAVALKFGMGSWTTNTTIAGSYYKRETDANDFPVIIGSEPGDMANAKKVGSRQCGDDPPLDGPIPTSGGADVSEIAHAYMNSGKPIAMPATAVFALLNDTDPSNDPFILSIRSSTQYPKGHIPGAINIGFRSLFTEENMSKLPTDDTLIVVVCYTGHTAGQAAALLNVNGFNATALKYGMTSWTNNETVAPSFYVREKDAKNHPVVIGSEPGTIADGVIVGPPVVDVLGATQDYLAMGKPIAITADAVYANLYDGFSGNDPFILSIRKAEDYAKGHIPGAVNIGRTGLFTPENLSKLPSNKQIVVVCYTGHSASHVTAMLNLAGYDAIALKFGMGSWTTNTTIAGSFYKRDTDANDFPVMIGSEPGDMANATKVGSRQCGDDPPVGPTPKVEGADVSEVAHSYMNSGKPIAMPATAVFALLNDTDPSNDPFILSIRSSTQYPKGHIPGAINIGFRSLFTDENTSKLPTDDTLIVVVCYTGHTASQAAALLNVNGYNATALKYGMTSWTNNETVAPSFYIREKDAKNFPVVIGSEPGTTADGVVVGPPVVDVLGATRDYLAMGKPATISASVLYANLNDGYSGNDPFILSIRSASQYEKGHIPGAVNIDRKGLFTEENLSLLPTNKQIVVVCYTGHSASQVTALLNLAGYDAVALKFGMTSWSTNTTVAPYFYNRDTDAYNYPVFIGEDPGDMANSTPVGRDCGDDNGGGGVSQIEGADVSEVANNYMNSGKPLSKKAPDVFALINDTNTTNDPFILSIRSASQYALGHIPGAINIGFRDVFTDENLSKLPTDDTLIVVVCYTGHTASQMAALLNVNGYNATALKFGMTSWTNNETVAPYFYDRATAAKNYPIINSTEAGKWADGVVVGKTDAEIIMEASKAYIEGGPRSINATTLYTLLNDTVSDNDPFILSIRSSALYALGHLPGSINIPWRSLFTLDNLSLLPDNETSIVVVSNTGQTAGQITALLNTLGFNATTLEFGMSSWTKNSTIVPDAFNNTTDQADYPMSNGSAPGSMDTASSRASGRTMGALYTGTSEEWEILRMAVDEYVSDVSTLTVSNKALFNNLNDNYTANDPYILSIRPYADYLVAHIPGAVNIQFTSLFTEENLSLLPTDMEIVVYCDTGQAAAQVVALLNLNGFNAVSLEFGVCSWTDNSTIADGCYDKDMDGNNFPVSTGNTPGDWASAKPAD